MLFQVCMYVCVKEPLSQSQSKACKIGPTNRLAVCVYVTLSMCAWLYSWCCEPTASGPWRLWAVQWLFKASNWLPVVLKLTWNRQAVMSCHLQHLAKCPTVPIELTCRICEGLCAGACKLMHFCVRACMNDSAKMSVCVTGGISFWSLSLRPWTKAVGISERWLVSGCCFTLCAAGPHWVYVCVCACRLVVFVCGQLYGLAIVPLALSRCGLNNELGK